MLLVRSLCKNIKLNLLYIHINILIGNYLIHPAN